MFPWLGVQHSRIEYIYMKIFWCTCSHFLEVFRDKQLRKMKHWLMIQHILILFNIKKNKNSLLKKIISFKNHWQSKETQCVYVNLKVNIRLFFTTRLKENNSWGLKKQHFKWRRFPWKTSAIFLKLKSKAFTEH